MKKTLLFLFLTVAVMMTAQEAQPYFTVAEMPNALHYLPGPPQTNEMRFAYDTARYQWGKRMRPTPRGAQAKADADYSVVRMAAIFSQAMGVEISPAHTPQLWKLLLDATLTASYATDSIKAFYMRPRPYMYYKEPTLVPEDEEVLSHNGSYPSGHTNLGWVTALILTQINPAAEEELLRIGFEYGISRVIAGFHWQSDVDAGRLTAAAAFAKLQTSPAYLKQLKKAKKEFQRLR